MIKPSELSVTSSNLLAELVPKYLDPVSMHHHAYVIQRIFLLLCLLHRSATL